MTINEEDEVRTLAPNEREEKNVTNTKFSLRALLVADCKKVLLFMSIIPMAATDVRGGIMRWGVEINKTSEAIPGVLLMREGFNNISIYLIDE